jgi:hypothetical protein
LLFVGGVRAKDANHKTNNKKIQPSPAKKIKTQCKPGVNSKCVFRHFELNSRRRGIDIIFSGERAKRQRVTQKEKNRLVPISLRNEPNGF